MRRAELTAVKIGLLVKDGSIYPRMDMDRANITALVDALKTGCQVPPIIAEKTSLRIVDGWHRHEAQRRLYGDDAEVKVELRGYKTEADLVLDAVSLNSGHGLRIAGVDQQKAVLICQEHGIDAQRISVALHITEEKVEHLKIRLIPAPTPDGRTELTPTKVSFRWIDPGEVSEKQAEGFGSAPGTSYALLATQLIDAMDHDLINPRDGELLAKLSKLRDRIALFLNGAERIAA